MMLILTSLIWYCNSEVIKGSYIEGDHLFEWAISSNFNQLNVLQDGGPIKMSKHQHEQMIHKFMNINEYQDQSINLRISQAIQLYQENLSKLAISNTDNTDNSLWKIHLWTNITCWGILVDVGILVARYGKFITHRIAVHSSLMIIIIIPSLFAELIMILGLSYPQEIQSYNTKITHVVIGFLCVSLMILQCISGIFVRMGILSETLIKNLKIRSQIHTYGGHTIYVLGKVQLGIGIYIVEFKDQKNALIGFWLFYIFVFLWRIILESLYINGGILKLFCQSNKQDEIEMENDSFRKAQLLNYIETNDTITLKNDYSQTLWCIFNNTVIDLTGMTHPGGNFIWKAVKGREISRFLYGAYGLENTFIPPYKHSIYAYQMIKQSTVGYLNEIPLFYQKNTLTVSALIGDESHQIWKLKRVEKITGNLSQFGFYNKNITLRTDLTGLNAMGRYFIISALQDKSITPRPYTMVLCTSQPNVDLRKKLEIYLEQNLTNSPSHIEIELVPSSPELPLLIKRYPSKNGLSQYIHSHPNESYVIQGPYGISFGLPQTGKIVVICGGTGLLPFLDLLDYFYKMTIYSILKEKISLEAAKYSNVSNLNFNTNLHLTLFIAVQGADDLVFKDIYLNMAKHQVHLKEPIFKLYIKSTQQIQGVDNITDRFDAQYFQMILNPEAIYYQKFLICGPPSMNREVPIDLMSIGVANEQIHLI